VPSHQPVDERQAVVGEADPAGAGVRLADRAGDQAPALEPVDPLGHRRRGDHGRGPELTRRQLVRRTVPPQRDQDVEVAVAEPFLGEDHSQLDVQHVREPVQPTDQPDR
jgi:hypothetical protein